MTKPTKRFTRQFIDPNGDMLSLNEHCSVSLMQQRAVVLKQGLRIIGFYDKWPAPEKLEYIRDELIGLLQDPRNAPNPDWALLAV